MNTKTNPKNDVFDAALKFQEMTLEQLRSKAKEMGVDIQSNDRSEVIDELIAASVKLPEEAKPGFLVSMHSRTPEAAELVIDVRNRILSNQQAKVRKTLFLKNSKGASYTQSAPGIRITTPEGLKRVLDILTLTPDGSQEAEIAALRETPELFETPWLVYLRRTNSDGSARNYVMLYVKRKQDEIAEQTF